MRSSVLLKHFGNTKIKKGEKIMERKYFIKVEIEKIEYSAEEISSLLLGFETSIFNGPYDIETYQIGYNHIILLALELKKQLKELREKI